MSFDIEITTEALRSYARTEDAVKAFNMTVANGQTRLALQVLVDIINSLVEKVEELEDKLEQLSPSTPEIATTLITPIQEEFTPQPEIKQEIKPVKEKAEDKVKV